MELQIIIAEHPELKPELEWMYERTLKDRLLREIVELIHRAIHKDE